MTPDQLRRLRAMEDQARRDAYVWGVETALSSSANADALATALAELEAAGPDHAAMEETRAVARLLWHDLKIWGNVPATCEEKVRQWPWLAAEGAKG